MIPSVLLAAGLSAPALAQSGVGGVDTLVTMETSNFFMALVAGVLLALGFQYVLTLLSAALGLSVVHIDPHHHDHDDLELNHAKDEDRHPRHLGLKITNGIGIWSMLTMTISLFLATWLAVHLSMGASAMTGLVLGLVIWAAFTLLATWMEMKSFGSLMNGIAHVATSGVRKTLGTAGHMLGHSRESEIKDIAENTVKAIRREFSEALEQSKIVEKLDDYVKQIKPEPIDYGRVRKEVEKLISRIQVTDTTRDGDRLLLLSVASKMPHLSKQDINTVAQSFDEVMELRNQQGLSATDKVIQGFDRFTPGTEEETRELRERIAEYLRRSQVEELNPEVLKRDLEQMIQQPQMAGQILRNKLEHLDHDSLVSVLSTRQDITPETAEKIVSQVEQVWESIQQRFHIGQGAEQPQQVAVNTEENSLVVAGQYPVDVNMGNTQMAGQEMQSKQRIPEQVEETIRETLNGLERPEFNYDLIKRDLKTIMHHPDMAPSILKERLMAYDRESMVALLGSTGMLSRRDIDKIADQIEHVREEVISKKEEVEYQVKERIERARRRAMERAEDARKTVATAGWWMLATATFFGLAAGLGGWLGGLY